MCKDGHGLLTQLKQQKSKRWYYPASHRLNVNVMLSIVIPPFRNRNMILVETRNDRNNFTMTENVLYPMALATAIQSFEHA